MPMVERRTYTGFYTIASGSTGKVSIFTVPPGKIAIIRKAVFWFPTGSEGELYVALSTGGRRLVPTSGWINGDNTKIELEPNETAESSFTVDLEYMNTGSTKSHSVFVALEVDIE